MEILTEFKQEVVTNEQSIEIMQETIIKSEPDDEPLESIIKIEPQKFQEVVVEIEKLDLNKVLKKKKSDEPWFVMKPYDLFSCFNEQINCDNEKSEEKQGHSKNVVPKINKKFTSSRKKPNMAKQDEISVKNTTEKGKILKAPTKRVSTKAKLVKSSDPKKTHQCDMCQEAFVVQSALLKHIEFDHNKNEIHQCPLCVYKSAARSTFVNHLTIHDKKEECPVCFKLVTGLKKHIRRHEGSVKCNLCDMTLSGKNALNTHIKRVHQRFQEFRCSECPERFDLKAELRSHTLKNHYKGKVYECHCGALFTGVTCFHRHRASHKRDPFICKVCKKVCTRKDGLIGHWKSKHLSAYGPLKFVVDSKACNFKGNFECDLCGRILPNRHCTLVHMKRFHKEPNYMSCDHCPAKFVMRSEMKDHVLNHLKFVRFSCEFCDFVGRSRRCIRQHRQIHLKVDCPLCGRPVAKLKGHLRMFHDENPRKNCEFCGENIFIKCMKKHIEAKHSGRHQCDQCQEKFNEKEYLRRHKLFAHYQGQLFECHCGSVYKKIYSLNEHQEKHERTTYTCEVCEKKFAMRTSLKMHWKVHEVVFGSFEDWEKKKSQEGALKSEI